MTATTLQPSQSDLTTAIRTFLLAELPAGVEVVLAEGNRVPEPASKNFVVMTPVRFDRLDTNLDAPLDLKMTGSISGSTMVVTAVDPLSPGWIVVGSLVFGVGVTGGTSVTGFGSGTGREGTYFVSPQQTLGPQTLSAGRKSLTQASQATVQLDFHSENTTDAGNMAQTIATLLRDDYGVSSFAAQPSDVVPLFADDPRQMPFVNDQQQYEWRWILMAEFQVNQRTTVPQEYADAVDVGLVEVDGR